MSGCMRLRADYSFAGGCWRRWERVCLDCMASSVE